MVVKVVRGLRRTGAATAMASVLTHGGEGGQVPKECTGAAIAMAGILIHGIVVGQTSKVCTGVAIAMAGVLTHGSDCGLVPRSPEGQQLQWQAS